MPAPGDPSVAGMARTALATRIAVLSTLLASACATGDGMHDKLRDATSGYNRAVRWSDFDRAAGFLPEASQTAFLTDREELDDRLIIVDYELTRLDLDKETGIAASRAEISWHTDRRLILETTSVDQLWQWHEGAFVLVDERRSGGTPLAIFAEPEEDVHPYLPGIEAYREQFAIGKDEKVERRKRRRARRRGDAPPSSAPTPTPATVARSRPTTGSPLAVDVPVR